MVKTPLVIKIANRSASASTSQCYEHKPGNDKHGVFTDWKQKNWLVTCLGLPSRNSDNSGHQPISHCPSKRNPNCHCKVPNKALCRLSLRFSVENSKPGMRHFLSSSRVCVLLKHSRVKIVFNWLLNLTSFLDCWSFFQKLSTAILISA